MSDPIERLADRFEREDDLASDSAHAALYDLLADEASEPTRNEDKEAA